MPFSEGSQVDVEQVDDTNWRLTGTLEYQGRTDQFVVPAGMLTDFASVPRPFVWFLLATAATPRRPSSTTTCGGNGRRTA